MPRTHRYYKKPALPPSSSLFHGRKAGRIVTIPSQRSAAARLHALIPAAGSGRRLGGALPKQHQRLGTRTLLEHTIEALLAEPRLAQLLVVVAADDAQVAAFDFGPRLRVARVGGPTRAASVRAGLEALAAQPDVAADDWVLVHDAARPCLAAEELAQLIDTLQDDPVGGLLALPLADTLKRDDGRPAPRVAATVDRGGLWRAATPQMFRCGLLRAALAAPGADQVTDEAAAVERLGHAPRLVAGRATNLKITTAGDLPLAGAILQLQGRLR